MLPKVTPEISALRNLGPRSAQMLAAAGTTTVQQLERLGAVGAYLQLKQLGHAASLNLLWALEGALTGRDWREVAKHDRLRLLLEVEARQGK